MLFIVKKTIEAIISTDNHHIIQVKGNRKSLFKQMKVTATNKKFCMDSFKEIPRARGRTETGETFPYKEINGISSGWSGLKRLIRIERTVLTKREESHETACYMSDIRSDRAYFFARHIRNHRAVENRLHWVKDAVMNKDKSRTNQVMAAENISIMRNTAVNLFRTNGYNSIKYAIELCADNFKEIIKLTECKYINYKIT